MREELDHNHAAPKRHAFILLGALAVFLLVNHAGAMFEGHFHQVDSDATKVIPQDRDPELLLVGASIGRRGLHPGIFDEVLFDGKPLTAKWFCDATPPSTWQYILTREDVLTPHVNIVVLQVAPYFMRYPGIFKDLALRRYFGPEDIPRIAMLGELQNASTIATVHAAPLYRYRGGVRQKAISLFLEGIGRDETEELERVLADDWPGWKSDPVEIESLKAITSDLTARHILVVIAEWPMSSTLQPSVEAAVRNGFRPDMQQLAKECGATFIPLPEGERYEFEDEVHPDDDDGRRWSRWLANELRTRGFAR